MIPIFIASNRSHTGKTFLALGLALKLIEQGYKVGYIKPVGKTPVKKGRDIFDADAVFIKDVLSLPDSLNVISPFVFSYEEQNLLFEGKIKDVKKRIMDALESQKNKDFVIIGGAGDLFEGTALDIDALSLIKDVNAYTIMIELWRGDSSMDTIWGTSNLLGDRFIGGIVNKVPLNAFTHVKETVKPFLERKGITVLGVFPKDSLLESITIRQLIEILNGRVLCCEDRLDDFVENFSIGAMDVDSALSYFSRIPNKAVITGAHRSDIQLAAMETSTKCIILTGGLYTNDVVIGKAQTKGVPIISVAEDTFTVIDRIEATMGKARIREKGKIERAKEIIDKEFDMKRFLKAVHGS
ncbi:MAG: phosphotransacetylase family protein [Nitrospiraceae bacterium]|nr:phosphotransacetylase family protein [Nitrospiraceae bacterium]